MKRYRLLLWLIIELIISGAMEIYIQTFEHITGIGIITMLYFVIINIHDMFMAEDKQNLRGEK